MINFQKLPIIFEILNFKMFFNIVNLNFIKCLRVIFLNIRLVNAEHYVSMIFFSIIVLLNLIVIFEIMSLFYQKQHFFNTIRNHLSYEHQNITLWNVREPGRRNKIAILTVKYNICSTRVQKHSWLLLCECFNQNLFHAAVVGNNWLYLIRLGLLSWTSSQLKSFCSY